MLKSLEKNLNLRKINYKYFASAKEAKEYGLIDEIFVTRKADKK